MDLVVACVGTRMPAWIAEGWQEYARRLPPHLKLEMVAVPVAGKAGAGRQSQIEAESLLARVPDRAGRVALHGAGRPWSTEQLSERLVQWQQDGDPIWFFIGGADGLDDSLLKTCQARWSLGPAVFPHMLVRVLVAEQLYRAWTILSGHPYHRG
jgi:23S rRNA (pseudouridine1915-N3)-methyltransferase